MKNFFGFLIILLALAACKKEQKQEAAKIPAPVISPAVPTVEELAVKSIANQEDWTKDLGIYLDDIMVCAKAVPGQTKYVFRADAFENPPIALVLLKTEADLVYVCSFNEGNPKPHFKKINLVVPKNVPRFYPGSLPKADSCLENTRILDKSGNIAGWLARITC